MKKRIFALLLALAMCLGLLPGTAWAAGDGAPTVWCMEGRPCEQGLQIDGNPSDSILNCVGNANGGYLLLSDPNDYGSSLTPTSVTVADPSVVTAALKTEWGATYIELTFLKEGETTLTVTAGDVTYAPVAVYVSPGQGGGSGDEDFSVSQPAHVTVNDVCYTVGFAMGSGDEFNIPINVGTIYPYQPEMAPTWCAPYVFSMAVGLEELDSGGGMYHYTEITDPDIASVKVNRLWIETDDSSKEYYSLSSDTEPVHELSGDLSNEIQVFYKTGPVECEATLKADITITTPTGTQTATVSVPFELFPERNSSYTRPADDTVEKLNADLKEYVKTFTEGSMNEAVNVVLNPKANYEGVIEIPSGSTADHCLKLFTPDGERVTVKGGISGGGKYVGALDNIDFIATDSVKTAIRDLNGVVFNCTFQGYDVAIHNGLGYTAAQRCVFADNKVAFLVDMARVVNPCININEKNTFVRNGTAAKLVSFNRWMPPYSFRMRESNFIGNTLDFDLQTANAVIYEYRNYYGGFVGDALNGTVGDFLDSLLNAKTASAVNGLVGYRRAMIRKAEGATVVTNPRWIFPAGGWWSDSNVLINSIFGGSAPARYSPRRAMYSAEEEYVNRLSADWEDETRIINTESADLTLDASAFEKEGEKVITVLDDQEGTLGEWSFGDTPSATMFSARAGASGSFDAGLTVEDGGDGAIVVTVRDSEVLGTYAPTLTIPGGSGWTGATVTGPDDTELETQWASGAVTFPVTAGGRYTVTAASTGTDSPDSGSTGSAGSGGGSSPAPATETVDKVEHTDGSVTTTITQPNGVTAAVLTTPAGETTAQVTVPPAVAAAKVTIPMADAGAGTVAVIVKPDGTREILKTSVAGEDGVTVRLTESAAIEIVDNAKEFEDVSRGGWAGNAVDFVSARGLFTGVSATRFRPGGEMDRGMVATVLCRLDGADLSMGASLDWAVEKGIVKGYQAGSLGAGDPVTREQLATMLYRYAEAAGMNVSGRAALIGFADAGKTSGWARDALAWAVDAGLIRGKGNATLDPSGTATRAEVAAVIQRLVMWMTER